MRTVVLSMAVLAALGLAGCSGGTGAEQGAGAANGSSVAAKVASSVSGTVGLRDPDAHKLSDQAKLTIELVDVSKRNAAPLAHKTISPIKSLPAKFKFDVTPKEVNASDLYVVKAEIVDGIRHYTMPLQAPVLTKGAASTATIRLVAVPTPAEKLFAAYKKMQAQAGAMKMNTGTSRNDKVAHGWQVFRDKKTGDIRYVVDQADFVDGGFNYTEYGYKNEKPWVIVRKHKSSQNAQPSVIYKLGWDGGGKIVLNKKVADGKTTKVDADKAAKLFDEAKDMFKKAKKSIK
ncbi:MAG TPA: YbaY family lipoprotein [Oleiagrimonas sp.]|nr:YbaY family lipoprotein [Oleiagrimonas sp.]